LSELDRITVNLQQCGGRPCIRGLRIRVTDILDLLAAGASHEEILETLYTLEPAGPAVVWIRLGNTRKQALLQWLESLFAEIVATLEQGERLIEIN